MDSTRRRAPRISTTNCLFDVRFDEGLLQLETINLSLGGAFFATRTHLPTETEVVITLSEHPNVTSCRATVVFQHERGFGVSFGSPPEDFLQAISDEMAAAT